MGGGIGIPPMLELARELPASAKKQIIVGYRDSQLFLRDDLAENGTVYIATEDGSVGTEGNVMNAIEENHLQADVILIDTAAEFIPETYASKATNTPFTGWKLKGEVKKTICGGKMVYEA